jgi:hypothetical protein
MPARPVVAATLKVEIEGNDGSHAWAVIQHCAYSGGPPSTADLDTFAAAIALVLKNDFIPLYSSYITFTQVVVTDLASISGNQGIATVASGSPSGGGYQGGNVATLVNYPSSIRYRGGHPRTYWPGGVQSDLASPSTWTTGYITAITAAITALQTVYWTSSYTSFVAAGQCAVSYVTAGAPRATPLVLTMARGAFSLPVELASQRRRIGRK